MRKELIWSLPGLYREDMEVYGYHFGRGDKAACVVGALRGNEVQQMYVCSQLVKALTELEAKGAIVNNNEILVIPAVNYYSMNIGKRLSFPAAPGARPRSGSRTACSPGSGSTATACSSPAFTCPASLCPMCG